MRGQDAERRRGELDGQRQAVEAAADRRDQRGVGRRDLEVRAHRAGPVEEQRRGRAGEQRLERGLVGRRLARERPTARPRRPARAARRARRGWWRGSSGRACGRGGRRGPARRRRTCSTVSRTRSVGAVRRARRRGTPRPDAPGSSPIPSAPAIAGSTIEASLTASSGTLATRPPARDDVAARRARRRGGSCRRHRPRPA